MNNKGPNNNSNIGMNTTANTFYHLSYLIGLMEEIFWHDCTFGKQVWDRLQNKTEFVQIA